jgi:hypothetical protein
LSILVHFGGARKVCLGAAQTLRNEKTELLHNGDPLLGLPVNKVPVAVAAPLISLESLRCSPIVHWQLLGTTVFTRFRSQKRNLRYDVSSSLKELSRTAVIVRESSSDSVIIPGDWGKVGPGWLARLLSSRSESFGGWRQDSPVPLQCSRIVVNAKKELGEEER